MIFVVFTSKVSYACVRVDGIMVSTHVTLEVVHFSFTALCSSIMEGGGVVESGLESARFWVNSKQSPR